MKKHGRIIKAIEKIYYTKHKMLSVCVCDRDGCNIPYGISLQEVFSACKNTVPYRYQGIFYFTVYIKWCKWNHRPVGW